MSFHRYMSSKTEYADEHGYTYTSTRYRELLSWTGLAPIALGCYFVMYLIERHRNRPLPPKIF